MNHCEGDDHKKHHEIIAPIGASAIYMTLVDLYIGNILPVYIPMFILSAHHNTILLWIVMTTINTVTKAHSGFEGLSNFHDKHHSSPMHNFGLGIFMDKLFGTEYVKKIKQDQPSNIKQDN